MRCSGACCPSLDDDSSKAFFEGAEAAVEKMHTEARKVVAIEYTPPAAGKAPLATTLDIMVLPEGQIGSGLPVMSFALQTSPGKQSFALTEATVGKGLWLRVAGPEGASALAIGDFAMVGE